MDYSVIVDQVLNSNDLSLVFTSLKEETYSVKNRNEFVNALKKLDLAIKKKGAKTQFSMDANTIDWTVEKANKGEDCVLSVKKFNDNGSIACDRTKTFKTPSAMNLNLFTNPNQILSLIDSFVDQYSEKMTEPDKDEEEEKKDETKDDEEEEFELDPALIRIMDRLKAKGNELMGKAKRVPEVTFGGKTYKIDKGEILASTEREAVLSLEFPRDQEINIYANNRDGQALRRAILKQYKRAGFNGKTFPKFRLDMEKTPYFYVSIGDIPVKKPTGDEAKALLNYFDGKKVKFQPASN